MPRRPISPRRASMRMASSPKVRPITAARRRALPLPSSSPISSSRAPDGRSSRVRPSASRVKPTCGHAIARRRTTSRQRPCSVRSVFRNLRRAGTALNSWRTATRVPRSRAAGCGMPTSPASTVICQASDAPCCTEVISSRDTAPIEGSASPRNPRNRMSSRRPSGSFEVA